MLAFASEKSENFHAAAVLPDSSIGTYSVVFCNMSCNTYNTVRVFIVDYELIYVSRC